MLSVELVAADEFEQLDALLSGVERHAGSKQTGPAAAPLQQQPAGHVDQHMQPHPAAAHAPAANSSARAPLQQRQHHGPAPATTQQKQQHVQGSWLHPAPFTGSGGPGGRRKLPASIAPEQPAKRANTWDARAGQRCDGGGSGGGSDSGSGGSSRMQPRWQQQLPGQQPQQQWPPQQQPQQQCPRHAGPGSGSGGAAAAGPSAPAWQVNEAARGSSCALRPLPFAGRAVLYAGDAAAVEAACAQLLAAQPRVVGFDVEWRPSFVKGTPPNKAALLQLAYAVKDGSDWQPVAEGAGRGVVVLLLHILHSGLTPKLQAILRDGQTLKVGVNIRGDVAKLASDYGVQASGSCDLSDVANGRQLRHVAHVTANTTPKRWSLGGLVEEVLALELPKPQAVRLGDWERRPLTLEQQRYAAMDAYACLLLHWELQALPTTATLSQQLRAVMRERAAAAAAAGDEGAL